MQAENDWDARVGDEVTIESHRLQAAGRTGVIAEVLGSAGHEYYRVRWADGHESVLHPGPDAVLHVRGGQRRAARTATRTTATSQEAERPAPSEQTAPAKPSRGSSLLRASPGDRLLIKGHHLGEPVRDAEILEVLGSGGGPPFRVRWWDTGREGILFPGADAAIEHFRRGRKLG